MSAATQQAATEVRIVKNFFIVVLNGEKKRLQLRDQQAFVLDNARQYPFGDRAMGYVSPIKGVFTFKDGNIVGMRGDRYTSAPVDMVRRLQSMAKKYYREDRLADIKIYDNRAGIIPFDGSLILHWNCDKGTLINLLPVYSGEFDLDNLKRKTITNGR